MADLAPLDRLDANKVRLLGAGARRFRRPISFVRYVDPDDRFVFSYPGEWKLQADDGVQASSSSVGGFVRVDILRESDDAWRRLAAAIERAGGTLEVRTASSERALGRLTLGDLGFWWVGAPTAWDADPSSSLWPASWNRRYPRRWPVTSTTSSARSAGTSGSAPVCETRPGLRAEGNARGWGEASRGDERAGRPVYAARPK